jgi:uncharacterized LabA/DUF88 family protein
MEQQLELFETEERRSRCVIYADINNLFHRYKKLDFVKIRNWVAERYDIVRCYAFNAVDLRNENQRKFNTYLSSNGWKVELSDTNEISNIDTMMATNMVLDSYSLKYETAILLACDNGYSYPANVLSQKGKFIHILGVKDNTGNCLLRCADSISYLEDIEGAIL